MKESKQNTKAEMLFRGITTNPVAIDAVEYLVALKPELRNQVIILAHRQIPGFLEWLLSFKHDHFFVEQRIDEISLEFYDDKTKLIALKLIFDKDVDRDSSRLIDSNPGDLKDCICINDNYNWRYGSDLSFNDIANNLITQTGVDEFRKFAIELEKKHKLRSILNITVEEALREIEQILAHKDTHTPAILWVKRPVVGRSYLEGRNELRLIPNELYEKISNKTKRNVPNEGNIF